MLSLALLKVCVEPITHESYHLLKTHASVFFIFLFNLEDNYPSLYYSRQIIAYFAIICPIFLIIGRIIYFL